MTEKPFGQKLLDSLSQKEKADLYNDFIQQYCTESQAQIALLYNNRQAAQLYLIARILDDRRINAERAGKTTSDRKARSSRENGRRGGRPRKEEKENERKIQN